MSEVNETATVAKTRVRHNLNNEQFVKVYTASNSAKEVAAELKVPVNVVNSRAAYLRKIGVTLKQFDTKRRRIDVASLQALAAPAAVEGEAQQG